MPDTTTVYDLPYLEPSDPPDIAGGLQDLAEAVEAELVRIDAAAARGVAAAGTVPLSGDVGTTETITASLTWTALAGRAYRVSVMTPALDNQASAAQTAIVTLRHAAGASVSNTGTLIAKAIANVPPTTTSTNPGAAAETVTLVAFINNPGAGQRTVGVGLAALSGSSNVRFLPGNTAGPDLNPSFVVEDCGPAY